MKALFHKTEKGLGDEDFYYVNLDPENNASSIVHEWSYTQGVGQPYTSGSRSYSPEEFAREKPNQHARLVDWLAGMSKVAS